MNKNMAAETTKKAKAASGWIGVLLESVFGSFQSLLGGVFGSVREMAQAFARKLARQTFLLLFAFLGSIFLLVGGAELISARYQLPGIGEIFIGIFILSISLIAHLVTKDD
jgi:hypothetical protein